jgi:hypothetical protein
MALRKGAAMEKIVKERGSYQGQDQFVLEVLGGKRDGFFLDSGASNGVAGSNTVVLEEEYGWKGICVEPNDSFFQELIRNRTALCLNCCLWSDDTEVEFLEAAGVYGGIVDQYEAKLLDHARSQAASAAHHVDQISTTNKRARSIRGVLREHGAPPVIDYWSLDTEGSELTLLRSFPFDEYGVRVITVEHNYTPARAAIAEILNLRGYRLAREMGIDDGFVRVETPARRSWRNRALLSARMA